MLGFVRKVGERWLGLGLGLGPFPTGQRTPHIHVGRKAKIGDKSSGLKVWAAPLLKERATRMSRVQSGVFGV